MTPPPPLPPEPPWPSPTSVLRIPVQATAPPPDRPALRVLECPSLGVRFLGGACRKGEHHGYSTTNLPPAYRPFQATRPHPHLTFFNNYVSQSNVTPTAPTTPKPTATVPPKDRPGTIPERLAAVLQLVRILLTHGRRLAETAADQAHNPQFATIAAVFGTYNLAFIVLRVQRGILRAIALERYLLARAARGRDLTIVPPRNRTPATPDAIPQPAQAKPPTYARHLPPNHPANFHIPGLQELEAQIRRRPIGRTIADICTDLAVIPGFCTAELWGGLFDALQFHGGSLTAMYKTRGHREQTFRRERDKRPETWHCNWQDLRPATIRHLLGHLIGETPPAPLLATPPP